MRNVYVKGDLKDTSIFFLMGKTKLERLGMLTWMIKLYRTQGSDYYKSQVTFGEKEG